MKLKNFLLVSLLTAIPLTASAEWKVRMPWDGIVRMWEDGTPASVIITGYTGPGPHLTVHEKITVENWQFVDGEEVVVQETVVPVLGVDGTPFFYCSNEIEDVTFSDGILFVNNFVGSESIKSVSFNGPVKYITNSFSDMPLMPLKNIILNGAERIEDSFNSGGFKDLTKLNLQHINKIVNSFGGAYIPEGTTYRLPEGLKVLKVVGWGGSYENKNSTLICPESLDSLEYPLNYNHKIVIPKECKFSISADRNSEIYYLGTKNEFVERITRSHWDDDKYRYVPDLSIWTTADISRHKIFTDSKLSDTGEPTGKLWTELTWPASSPIIPNDFISSYRYLERLSVPAIEEIGRRAFLNCWGLKEINVNANKIGESAFALRNGYDPEQPAFLNKISIGSNVHKMESEAFYGCEVEDFVVDKSLKDWLDMERTSELSGVYWAQPPVDALFNTRIHNLTIGGKKMTGTIEIPSGVTKIPTNALPGNTIVSMVIPSSVTSVEQSAMSNSDELVSVQFAASDSRSVNNLEIGRYAFSNCTKLAEIEFNRIPDVVGGDAFEGTAWYEAQPDGNVIIGDDVLYRYKGSNALVDGNFKVPEGIRVICQNAFDDMESNLISLDLPETLTALYSQAHLSALTDIYSRSRTPNKYEDETYLLLPKQFYTGKGKIHVYEDAVDIYKNTDGWNGAWLPGGWELSKTNIEAYDFMSSVELTEMGDKFLVKGMTISFSTAVKYAAVYDISGNQVWSGNASDEQVSLPAKGIYLLNIDGRTYKILAH